MAAPTSPQTSESKPVMPAVDPFSLEANHQSLDQIAEGVDRAEGANLFTQLDQGGNVVPGQVPPEVANIPAHPAAPPAPQFAQEQAPLPDPSQPQPPQAPPESALTPKEQEGLRTTNELAELFGVTEPDLFNAIHIAGQDGTEVPLAQVVDAWRAQPDAAEVAAKRETLEGEYQERIATAQEQHDEMMTRAAQLTEVLHRRLTASQVPEHELAQLEHSDPQRWTQIKLKQQEDQQALQMSIQQLQQEMQRRDAENTKRQQQWEAEQTAALTQAWPEYVAPGTAATTQAAVRQFLGGHGFRKEEIDELPKDHRFIKIIRDAMNAKELQTIGAQQIQEARERGLRPPPSGAPVRHELPSEAQLTAEQQQSRMEALRKSGSVEAAAAVLEGIL